MYRFWTIFVAHLQMTLRNRMAMFWTILFPVAYLLFFGFINIGSGNNSVVAGAGQSGKVGYVAYLTIGVLIMQAMSVAIMGYGRNITAWRDQGVLRRLAVTPLPSWEFLLALLAGQLVLILLNAALVMAVSAVLFGVRFSIAGAGIGFAVFLLAILVYLGIGQLTFALAKKTDTVNAVSQVIYFFLIFLGGIFLPVEVFPQVVQQALRVLPTTLALDVMRPSLLLGAVSGVVALDAIGLAVYFVVLFALSARSFRWEQAA